MIPWDLVTIDTELDVDLSEFPTYASYVHPHPSFAKRLFEIAVGLKLSCKTTRCGFSESRN